MGFSDQRVLARAVLTYFNAISIRYNIEFGGLFGFDGSVYRATDAVSGDAYGVNLESVAGQLAGKLSGLWHTHGAYSVTVGDGRATTRVDKHGTDGRFGIRENPANDKFSSTDINAANGVFEDLGRPGEFRSYLGTPGGTFYEYDPGWNTIEDF